MFFTFLCRCFRCICEFIDFIKEIFYMLCGIESVEIDGSKGDMLKISVVRIPGRRRF